MATTYSFKDLIGAFTHPLAGAYILSGNIGLGQVTVSMVTEKTSTDISADGTPMISYIAGDNGTVTLECQQTSNLNSFMLGWFNAVNVSAKGGDVSNWANAALTLRNATTGTSHICTGGAPAKVPDKTYAAQGGKVNWIVPFADIQNVTI